MYKYTFTVKCLSNVLNKFVHKVCGSEKSKKDNTYLMQEERLSTILLYMILGKDVVINP